MKIATFTSPSGVRQWGVIDDENQTILGSADLEEAYYAYLPETVEELINLGDEGVLLLATALEKHRETPIALPYALSEVLLETPFTPHRNIFCVGKNYREHIAEFDKTGGEPEHPIFFTKLPTTVTGPNGVIPLHPHATSEVDYEGELALIIGKRGSNIPEDKVYDYIFGYTIINDVTARDLQRRHNQWFLGKSLDGFCPMGPAILISDKQPKDFEIRTYVNSELRQSGTTEDLIFSIPTLISTLSRGLTLEPGDIIATGTPSGVGVGFNPPRFLQEDDEVSITIPGIGTLANTVKINVPQTEIEDYEIE
ncbi:fumarylacetoacetate hydrolase family protein [Veillonella criceti]|uniref:4-hydroxyphenylacetate degradation bifunctional isomerase/decarboxylase n=1 Tax=Veillonella criceti TaxID=103891 RepID=A0A380NLM2_9FIRM|nr:fumarylacetoacetate hydrolase family protein [Veillonella criceti]SUP42709.1 4-hydroxyphenylacetate degradation bifunctional isomerase/decarboxylase [Veillonella criceti]